jgi:hypothetical protein
VGAVVEVELGHVVDFLAQVQPEVKVTKLFVQYPLQYGVAMVLIL